MPFITKKWRNEEESRETPITAESSVELEEKLAKYTEEFAEGKLREVATYGKTEPTSELAKGAIYYQTNAGGATVWLGQHPSGPIKIGVLGPAEIEPTLELLHIDPMTIASPVGVWGIIQAQEASRYELLSEVDPWLRGDGTKQVATHVRRLILDKGDVFAETERTELGANAANHGQSNAEGVCPSEGTFCLYPQGVVRSTFYSMRLAANFPIANANWQVITQMKQTQPYSEDNLGKVVLELEARQNQFQIIVPPSQEASPLWTMPAVVNTWYRFRWDVFYSNLPSESSKPYVRLRVHKNEGLSANSPFEPGFDSGYLYPPDGTLASAAKEETGGSPPVTYTKGEAIPSHLRMGIYRNTVIGTELGEATHNDIGNVQVYDLT